MEVQEHAGVMTWFADIRGRVRNARSSCISIT